MDQQTAKASVGLVEPTAERVRKTAAQQPTAPTPPACAYQNNLSASEGWMQAANFEASKSDEPLCHL